MKLYFELAIHYKLLIKKKKLLNFQDSKQKMENLIIEDLKFLINHSEYNQKIANYNNLLRVVL